MSIKRMIRTFHSHVMPFLRWHVFPGSPGGVCGEEFLCSRDVVNSGATARNQKHHKNAGQQIFTLIVFPCVSWHNWVSVMLCLGLPLFWNVILKCFKIISRAKTTTCWTHLQPMISAITIEVSRLWSLKLLSGRGPFHLVPIKHKTRTSIYPTTESNIFEVWSTWVSRGFLWLWFWQVFYTWHDARCFWHLSKHKPTERTFWFFCKAHN